MRRLNRGRGLIDPVRRMSASLETHRIPHRRETSRWASADPSPEFPATGMTQRRSWTSHRYAANKTSDLSFGVEKRAETISPRSRPFLLISNAIQSGPIRLSDGYCDRRRYSFSSGFSFAFRRSPSRHRAGAGSPVGVCGCAVHNLHGSHRRNDRCHRHADDCWLAGRHRSL